MEISTNGQQEYSSRQAGVTTGIVLGCLIPILLLIVFAAFRLLKQQRKQREEEEAQARERSVELLRLRNIGKDEQPATYSSKATDIN